MNRILALIFLIGYGRFLYAQEVRFGVEIELERKEYINLVDDIDGESVMKAVQWDRLSDNTRDKFLNEFIDSPYALDRIKEVDEILHRRLVTEFNLEAQSLVIPKEASEARRSGSGRIILPGNAPPSVPQGGSRLIIPAGPDQAGQSRRGRIIVQENSSVINPNDKNFVIPEKKGPKLEGEVTRKSGVVSRDYRDYKGLREYWKKLPREMKEKFFSYDAASKKAKSELVELGLKKFRNREVAFKWKPKAKLGEFYELTKDGNGILELKFRDDVIVTGKARAYEIVKMLTDRIGKTQILNNPDKYYGTSHFVGIHVHSSLIGSSWNLEETKSVADELRKLNLLQHLSHKFDDGSRAVKIFDPMDFTLNNYHSDLFSGGTIRVVDRGRIETREIAIALPELLALQEEIHRLSAEEARVAIAQKIDEIVKNDPQILHWVLKHDPNLIRSDFLMYVTPKAKSVNMNDYEVILGDEQESYDSIRKRLGQKDFLDLFKEGFNNPRNQNVREEMTRFLLNSNLSLEEIAELAHDIGSYDDRIALFNKARLKIKSEEDIIKVLNILSGFRKKLAEQFLKSVAPIIYTDEILSKFFYKNLKTMLPQKRLTTDQMNLIGEISFKYHEKNKYALGVVDLLQTVMDSIEDKYPGYENFCRSLP